MSGNVVRKLLNKKVSCYWNRLCDGSCCPDWLVTVRMAGKHWQLRADPWEGVPYPQAPSILRSSSAYIYLYWIRY